MERECPCDTKKLISISESKPLLLRLILDKTKSTGFNNPEENMSLEVRNNITFTK